MDTEGVDTEGVGDFVVLRGSTRFVSEEPGLMSRHSFSFGRHYDPGNVGFGMLVLNNDDLVQPGAGYPTHPHRDVEIVTWVLDGALAHRDSAGGGGVIYPGLAQRLSAGHGVNHSEYNDAPVRGPAASTDGWYRTGDLGHAHGPLPGETDGAVTVDGSSGEPSLRFVQMWVSPDECGVDPSYEQCDVSKDLTAGQLVTVASGMRRYADTAAVGLRQGAAAMHVAQLTAGGAATLPSAPFVHVYVTRGTADIEGVGRLDGGDAVRITDEGGRHVHPVVDAEIIVWEMHATVRASG